MDNQLHHLETPSMYGEIQREPEIIHPRPPMALPVRDGISTPTYIVPNERSRDLLIPGLYAIPPETFNGTKDPRRWLIQYEAISKANQWNNEMKFAQLIRALTDSPLLWYMNEIESARKGGDYFGWDEFKRGLIDKYTNKFEGTLTEDEVLWLRQEDKESLNEYWEFKRSQMDIICPHLSEESKIGYLIKGLKPALKAKVWDKFVTKQPTDLVSAYDLVKKIDDIKRISKQFSQSHDFQRGGENRSYNQKPNRGKNEFTGDIGNQMNKLIRGMESLGTQVKEISVNNRQNPNNWSRNQNTYPPRPSFTPRQTFTPRQNLPQRQDYPQRQDGFRNEYPRNSTRFPERQVRFSEPKQSPDRDNFNPRSGNNTKPKMPSDVPIPREPPVTTQFRRDVSTIQCWHCKEMGHYSFSCPNKPMPTQSKNV
jgi:hypothetical protein